MNARTFCRQEGKRLSPTVSIGQKKLFGQGRADRADEVRAFPYEDRRKVLAAPTERIDIKYLNRFRSFQQFREAGGEEQNDETTSLTIGRRRRRCHSRDIGRVCNLRGMNKRSHPLLEERLAVHLHLFQSRRDRTRLPLWVATLRRHSDPGLPKAVRRRGGQRPALCPCGVFAVDRQRELPDGFGDGLDTCPRHWARHGGEGSTGTPVGPGTPNTSQRAGAASCDAEDVSRCFWNMQIIAPGSVF